MPTPQPAQRTRRTGRFPSQYWFPVAAAYGALILPWSVLGQLDLLPAPPGIASHVGHAHEMLFGFALAVVAGWPRRLRPCTCARPSGATEPWHWSSWGWPRRC